MSNKYGAKKVELDGIVFDSELEAKYYMQLKWLEKNEQILFFRLQPRYLLQEAFEKHGKKHRKIEYVADFEIHHLDGSIETVDVKGYETTDFKIKKKLFEYKYPHKLSLVTYSKIDGGWIELDELAKRRKERQKAHEKNIRKGVSQQKQRRRKASGG